MQAVAEAVPIGASGSSGPGGGGSAEDAAARANAAVLLRQQNKKIRALEDKNAGLERQLEDMRAALAAAGVRETRRACAATPAAADPM